MPRKTTILIVILAAITGILIFLAVRSDTTMQLVNKTPEPTPTTAPEPYASLDFGTSLLDISLLSANQTVDVVLDTNNKPVAGVQVELSYDPTVLSNVRLIPAQQAFFGPSSQVLISAVDSEQGRISYATAISAQGSEVSGRAVIVRIGFTANKSKGVQGTLISFLTKSAVTTLASQNSVLKSTTPLQIKRTASQPAN